MRFAWMIRSASVAAALLLLVFGAIQGASAENMSFMIRNSHPNALEVELYSDTRSHVWPGNNEVYVFDDGETKQIDLECESGEKICYGAWISGDENTYWGVGPNNETSCSDCCYACDGGHTEEINLVP